MLNIAICEDNREILCFYKLIVNKFIVDHPDNQLRLSIATRDPYELESYIEQVDNNIPCVYILDIEFAGSVKKGIELAQQANKHSNNVKIIFISTHEEMSIVSFQYRVAPLDFISKENGMDKVKEVLFRDLDKILYDENSTIANRVFMYNVGARLVKVKFEDINFFESSTNPHKVVIHTKYGTAEFRSSLKALAESSGDLFRVYRSLLINVSNVLAIDGKYVTFKDNSKFELNKRLLSRIKNWISR
ncbi:LytR/AlgR family response regulator transcription factor [Lactiplantibacillus plantarum]|uniref:LytR/AlgR family response regulator transcription factor n=1 Tax=Lactiplantibacillus plantarum TaxID=1590 RepID=UPI001AAFE418|nr:LytTR family transcriptional regulator DNA-binding domain-containing protein [Lactiplantibacillus plantarum]MBO2705787.1 response regulator [Lactiplantibacillus plantarum]MDN7038279.1 response regulator transcription factor [Lactiplantibacillus plantarum]MDO7795370.1 DNA-binding response regulator [Lactiplantibacillus plantarum]WVI00474.1 DNA-binding response regulator [Lactiplantibacillus plantarum]